MKKKKFWASYKKHQRYIARKALKRYLNTKKPIMNKVIYKGNNHYTDFLFSKVLTALGDSKFSIEQSLDIKEIMDFEMPKIFCFSKNPNETILFLRRLYTALINRQVKQINFNHFTCEYLGVCASTVMDIIIIECLRWRKRNRYQIKISGMVKDHKISNNDEVDLLVKISGLLQHLNITAGINLNNIETLPIIVGEESSYVAENTISYINRSLSRHNFELTKAGQNLFGRLVGEIVDNCKIHAGDNAIWYTLGHYYFDPNTLLGKCKLTIIDFGNTIYEGLKYHSSPTILKRINHYIKRNWCSSKSVRSEETLYTLFSLQQRVSRIICKDKYRGNGTVEFIESILKLFNTENAKFKSFFSITSGKCSILFDGKYSLQEKIYKNGLANKIIAFNSTNNLYDKPDDSYVRTIENGFPGTVFSMDLFIDKQYLKGVTNENYN